MGASESKVANGESNIEDVKKKLNEIRSLKAEEEKKLLQLLEAESTPSFGSEVNAEERRRTRLSRDRQPWRKNSSSRFEKLRKQLPDWSQVTKTVRPSLVFLVAS